MDVGRLNAGVVAATCNDATTGGRRDPDPQNLDGPVQLFDEECDYRYVTDCSAQNWVYHPYFVLYNNLDQGIGPQP